MVYYDIEFPKNREHEAVTEVCSQAMNQDSTVGGKSERLVLLCDGLFVCSVRVTGVINLVTKNCQSD